MADRFSVLIMAAGLGTRMRSEVPKVLHPVAGKPMVGWVIDAARAAGADEVVCIVRPGDGVEEGLPDGVSVARQEQGEGTGSAVLAARERLTDGGSFVVLSGDHPLVSEELISDLVSTHKGDRAIATLLTTSDLDPAGYGRIVRRDDGRVDRIVETKYPDRVPDEELAIREINLGTYVFEGPELVEALDEVGEIDGEIHLTEAFPVLSANGGRLAVEETHDPLSALGVNSRVELMEAERLAQRKLIEEHARAGVTFVSPETTSVDAGVEIGEDTTIAPGVSLRGATRVGEGCEVGPHSTLVDATLGDRVTVPHSYLLECEVEDEATIGPFAYLRPGAVVHEKAKVGTFVEVKNSEIGRGAKVPHLSYIGDADVGEESNLGASTITANYDGKEKHRTKLGKRVKTGIHTSLVAPLNVGDGAYTGAGSAITEDIPDDALGIARQRQTNIEGYAERDEEDSPE
ncbi:MAG TPA: bifunctional UDP-N-acetylglucosamine diphosphorylase/glucosamine-1-phosphate N-acetyltransferase GlmU [Thermoleophilaceae bacterium]